MILIGAALLAPPALPQNIPKPSLSLKTRHDTLKVEVTFNRTTDTLVWHALLSLEPGPGGGPFSFTQLPDGPMLPQLTLFVPCRNSRAPQVVWEEGSGDSVVLHRPQLRTGISAGFDGQSERPENRFQWLRLRGRASSRPRTQVITWLGKYYLVIDLPIAVVDYQRQRVIVKKHLRFSITPSHLVTGSPQWTLTPELEDSLSTTLPPYLIITPPGFEPYLQELVDWKRRKGHQVTVVTTAETGSGRNSIKNFIQSYWTTHEPRPLYLLLIGDEDRGIPGFYINNPEGDPQVTDLPYTLLEGDDVFPEMYVGRLSVDSYAQLLTVINKIVHYESTPWVSDSTWYRRALMVGNASYAPSIQQVKNWVRQELLQHGFTQVDTVYYPYQQATALINTAINNGVNFVNYRGFGSYGGWSGPYYGTEDLYSSLNNGWRLPVVTSIVCGGGNYAAPGDPCFGEAWLRLGTSGVPRGAVAFFGPSELYTHTMFNNIIDMGLYGGILDGGLHVLGPATWAGKLELWREFHDNAFAPFGQTPEFYFHIYNILGDPGLSLWTAAPRRLQVEVESPIPPGTRNLAIRVTDTTGNPVAKAFVFLYNDTNAQGAYTDASGWAYVAFRPDSESSVHLTVTGDNLLPYEIDLPVLNASNWLQADSIFLARPLRAGHAEFLNLRLQVGSVPLHDLQLEFSSSATFLQFDPVTLNFPFLNPGQLLILPQATRVSCAADIPHGTTTAIAVRAVAGSLDYNWYLPLGIQAPRAELSHPQIVEWSFEPGDSLKLRFELYNTGGDTLPATFLSFQTDSLLSTPETLAVPALPPGSNIELASLSFAIRTRLFPQEPLSLTAAVGNNEFVFPMEIRGGQLMPFAPLPPDEYGYRAFDDDDWGYSERPAYHWLEVDPALGGHGVPLPIVDIQEGADAATAYSIPIPITFYGQTYHEITICSNGWLAMGSQGGRVDFHNRRLPSLLAPPALIAPFWDDLRAPGDAVFAYLSSDSSRFVVEWSRLHNAASLDTLSFQVVFLLDEETPTGDTPFLFQYRRIADTDSWQNFATIGIQGPQRRRGVQLSYNHILSPAMSPLRAGKAIKFTTGRGVRAAPPRLEWPGASFTYQLNPWSETRDSLLLHNGGQTPLVYVIQRADLDAPRLDPGPLPEQRTKEAPDEILFVHRRPAEQGDTYGYTWKGSWEPGGPVYQWIDIAEPANYVSYPGDPDDIAIGPFELGFPFPFYDSLFSRLNICSNGFVEFLTRDAPWRNQPLPYPLAPPAMIAPWWDDLNLDSGTQGSIYFWTNQEDSAVVSFINMPKWGTSQHYTFQVLLTADGNILFQYQHLDEPRTSATVGMQNATRDRGFAVVYNGASMINDQTAVRIQRPYRWFRAGQWTGLIPPDSTAYFTFTLNSDGLATGTYSMPLKLLTNAVNVPDTSFTIQLQVVEGVHPVGDVNLDYRINVTDVTLLLEFILLEESPEPEQFSVADLNGDDRLDILDAVLLVEQILEGI